MRLLLAEDDPQLGPTLARGLREQSYAVDLVTDGQNAIFSAAVNAYDVIILDYMLPTADGLAVAKEIRQRGQTTPILFLTARAAVQDRIAGLDAGADDYLVKPFSFGELLARLRALSRRGAALLPSTITVGDLILDTRSHVLTKRGAEVPLTSKEYALFEHLARNAGAVVSRMDITAHVWDDNHDPMSNNLEVFINRVRRRIDDPGRESYIKTRRGAGYVLVSPPSESSDTSHS
ncbi:MAG TPA: response regulator transcription factor [Gemmatimonadaceae bacterium]|jgi:two-component system copper resistance phosphate regulon response regulator CusR